MAPRNGVPTEARKNPERDAKSGGNAKPVKQRVIRRRLKVAVGQAGAIREKIRRMKLDRGEQGKHRTDDEPERRAAKQREQRDAAGTVNFRCR